MISVVMPMYNAERFVGEAIESILRQTHADFELLVLDDCSTDRSRDEVAKFSDPRIRMHANERNLGIGATLNRGLALATGELIARMDADDISLPRRFELQAGRFAADPRLVLCGGNVVSISERGAPLSGPWYCGAEDIAWGLLFYSPIPHPTAMFRASLVSGLAYPATDAEDVSLWRQMLGRGTFFRTQEVLLKYRQYATSTYRTRHAQYERVALESARGLFERLVGARDAEALLVLTRHWREAGAPAPRPPLAQLVRAGQALVAAYRRAFAPQADPGALGRELQLRTAAYAFGANGRFAGRGGFRRVAAAMGEWLGTLGAASLACVGAILLFRRLRRSARALAGGLQWR